MNGIKVARNRFVVSVFFVMIINPCSYGGFHEGWEDASVGSYSLSDRIDASLLKADEGTWFANRQKTEIIEILGDQALRLTSSLTSGGCAGNIWVSLTDWSKTSELQINKNFNITLAVDTFIYFEEIGELDLWDNQDEMGTYDKISLTLQDLNDNEIVYVLQRDLAAEPIHEPAYREIFLEPNDMGSYQRNLYEDFSSLPNFEPKSAKISQIVFEIDNYGWAIIDDIVIGKNTEMPDPPESRASFYGLGLLPNSQWCTVNALSSDGQIVVGHDEHAGLPVYWNEAMGMMPLPLGITEGLAATRANALSSDGSVIVGTSPSTVFDAASEKDQEAFYWTHTDGMKSLGYPAGVSGMLASAQGVSGDGSHVVGFFRGADDHFTAFSWTESDNMIDLTLLPGGQTDSGATAISYDGQVVVGWSHSANATASEPGSTAGSEAFRWTATEGMVGLGFLPGGGQSEASAASMDGTVIVGASTSEATQDSDNSYEAFTWSQLDGMDRLGVMPGYGDSRARAVSGDGSIVVGSTTEDFELSVDAMTGDSKAFIWGAEHGLQDLKTVLGKGYHVNVSGWQLLEAIGISADGCTIVGNGINPQGDIEPWLAVIPSRYPALDLDIVNPKLPDNVVSGGGAKITLPVSVTNTSERPIEKSETIDLIIKARPLDGGPDVRLMVVKNQVIGVLNPEKTKKLSVALYTPPGIPTNDYVFVVQVGMLEVTTPVEQPVTIEFGQVTLVGEITKSTLPESLIVGETAKGTASVQITNQGNIVVEKNKAVNVTLFLRSLTSDDKFEVGQIDDYKIGGLKPGKNKTASVSVEDIVAVPEGTYDLLALIEHSDENLAAEPVLGHQVTIAQPFVDLQMELVKASLPSSHLIGDEYKGSIKINVVNRGNVATEKSAEETIKIMARSIDDGMEVSLIPVETALGAISPGKAKAVTVLVALPVNVEQGQFVLVMLLGDNELVLDSSIITITRPSIDLTGTTGAASYTADLSSEESGVIFTFDIINNGTSTTGKNQTIDIAVYLRNASDQDIPAGVAEEVSIGSLASGGHKSLSLSMPAPPDLEEGEYRLAVLLDSSDVVTEPDETDNRLEWADTLNIKPVEGFMDLTMFNSGKSMDYLTTIKGEYYDCDGEGVQTQNYDTNGHVSESSFCGKMQEYGWSVLDDGVHLISYDWNRPNWWQYYNASFDVLIAPGQLKLNEKVTSTSSIWGTHHIVDNASLSGTVQTSCTLKKQESITVNEIKYAAYKIILDLEIDAKGNIQELPYASTIKQAVTYWAVPHVGVVKSRTTSSAKISLDGASDTWRGTVERELIN